MVMRRAFELAVVLTWTLYRSGAEKKLLELVAREWGGGGVVLVAGWLKER